jgi:hypothetical protein
MNRVHPGEGGNPTGKVSVLDQAITGRQKARTLPKTQVDLNRLNERDLP